MFCNKWKYLAALVIGSVLFWGFALYVINTYADVYRQQVKEELREESRRHIALVRASLEGIVFQAVYTADTLASIIAIKPTFAVENWESVARPLLSKSKYIRSLTLEPDNVIAHVYPVEGNEKAIGIDLRRDPDQFAAVMKAKELKSAYLDGPIELFQGGKALIARFPIFLDAPRNQAYWGTVSAILNYEQILRDSGVYQSTRLNIALRRYTPTNQEPVVFFGDAKTFRAAEILLPISLPNSKFEIASTKKANAYVEKHSNPVFVSGLVAAAGIYLSALLLLRSLKAAKNSSLKDELTKLPNRRFFMNYINHKLASKRKPDFTLLNIDLNDFKIVNDTFGHGAGDIFLKHIAQVLVFSVRSSDFVARMGGDEFVVILDRISNLNDAEKVVDKIRARAEASPLNYQGKTIPISLSIGIAMSSSLIEGGAEAIIIESDRSMYFDKAIQKSANAKPYPHNTNSTH